MCEAKSKKGKGKWKMKNGEQAYVVNEFRRKSIRAIASGIKLKWLWSGGFIVIGKEFGEGVAAGKFAEQEGECLS